MPESLQHHVQPSSLSPSVATRYNADGFLKYSLKGFPLCSSYAQVFRNGCLEYGDGYVLNAYRDDGLEKQNQIPSKDFEKKLCQIYENALRTLNAMNDDGPIYISCTLISIKCLPAEPRKFHRPLLSHVGSKSAEVVPRMPDR
jgi:hypothetical protein